MHCLPEEGLDHGIAHIDMWLRDGDLSATVDKAATLFSRVYSYVDVDEDDMLTLYEYGAALQRIRSKPQSAAEFLFFITDTNNDDHGRGHGRNNADRNRTATTATATATTSPIRSTTTTPTAPTTQTQQHQRANISNNIIH